MQTFIAVLRVLLSLAIVLLLAYWCIRYLLPRMQATGGTQTGILSVVGRLQLGVRSTLCLVRVGERYFLIGVTPGKMECLAEFPADELPLTVHEPPKQPDFAEILEKSKAGVQKFREKIQERTYNTSEKKEQGQENDQQDNCNGT
ncbi:MAG: flagellar biosynthetic protein FliO [Bacillota bacterium]|nr:flagellar biosynthetic protein FliO [Bacillota bacterium]MDW7683003.1 flagellar biosynthetic protein FliO [Bacillota bacterium]